MQWSQVLKTWRTVATNVFLELFGGLILDDALWQPLVTLPYGASIAINASLGNSFVVTVTDGNAFAFAAPTNPPATGFGQTINITIKNASGGAAGAGTWDAVFKTDGNVPAIADGNNRTFGFTWDGTNWIETYQSAADVSN